MADKFQYNQGDVGPKMTRDQLIRHLADNSEARMREMDMDSSEHAQMMDNYQMQRAAHVRPPGAVPSYSGGVSRGRAPMPTAEKSEPPQQGGGIGGLASAVIPLLTSDERKKEQILAIEQSYRPDSEKKYLIDKLITNFHSGEQRGGQLDAPARGKIQMSGFETQEQFDQEEEDVALLAKMWAAFRMAEKPARQKPKNDAPPPPPEYAPDIYEVEDVYNPWPDREPPPRMEKGEGMGAGIQYPWPGQEFERGAPNMDTISRDPWEGRVRNKDFDTLDMYAREHDAAMRPHGEMGRAMADLRREDMGVRSELGHRAEMPETTDMQGLVGRGVDQEASRVDKFIERLMQNRKSLVSGEK